MITNRDKKRGWGDEIHYLTHYRSITLGDAIIQAMDNGLLSFEDAYKRYAYEKRWPYERAQQHLLDLGADKDQQRVRKVRFQNTSSDYRSPLWQEQVHQAVEQYAQTLWSQEGTEALEYILSRGLRYKTIEAAKLGLSKQGGIPRLIIPLRNFRFHEYSGGWYFTIFRRDLRPDCPKGERWKNAKGSSTDALYMADCLKAKRTTVLTEGAIDALSIAQECGDLVNVVATAGVTCGQNVENLARLSLMPLVLVAFDADEAGDKEAKWWLERLPNARRLRPLLHDVNDMLVDNWDMREWIKRELPIEETLEVEESMCAVCLDLGRETVAQHEVDEFMYCDEHKPLDNNSRSNDYTSNDYTQELVEA
jgi:5S rRNA maturation endonuclease (ribonuclease M5)